MKEKHFQLLILSAAEPQIGIKMNRKFQKILVIGALLFGLWGNSLLALAAELTVTAEAAKIRAEANTTSEVVGSAQRGKKLTSEGETTESGYVWYKVAVEGNNYGYIRSDLVEVSGGGGAAGSSTAAAGTTNPTPIAEKQMTVSQASVKVRSGASTNHDAVTSIPENTVITVFGEAKDNAGKTWYQMKCTVDGREITGYVRSDLVTAGASGQPEGEADGVLTETGAEDGENQAGEGDAAVPEENQDDADAAGVPAADTQEMDYAVVYEADEETGENMYFLYDYSQEQVYRQKLQPLLELAAVVNTNDELHQKELNNQKIIIIVLAVLIVALALIVTFLIFKIRDLYNSYDDEEEGDELDDYPSGRRNRVPEEDDDETDRMPGKRPVRPETGRPPADRSQGRPQGTPRPAPVPRSREDAERPERRSRGGGDAELHATENRPRPERRNGGPGRDGGGERPVRQGGKPAPKPRRTHNFLNDDDEFEFEFLNMDDKDL